MKSMVFSDKPILNEYYSKYEPKLLEGHLDGWIERDKEQELIEKLRNYYQDASRADKKTVNVTPQSFRPTSEKVYMITPKIKEGMTRPQLAFQYSKDSFIPIGITSILGSIATGMNMDMAKSKGRALLGGLAGISAVSGIASLPFIVRGIKESGKKHYLTPKGIARDRSRFSDEQLLSLLRGQAIKNDIIKKKVFYI